MLETNQSIAAFLQMCEDYGLGLDFDQRLPRLLNAVTLEQVRAAAAEVLDPARAAIAIAGPYVRHVRTRERATQRLLRPPLASAPGSSSFVLPSSFLP